MELLEETKIELLESDVTAENDVSTIDAKAMNKKIYGDNN